MKEILVVDDNPMTLLYMSSVLKKRGYVVHTSTSGGDALDILSTSNEIQFVLSDWVMPGMDGLELCKILKS